jgi:hypothetical protein
VFPFISDMTFDSVAGIAVDPHVPPVDPPAFGMPVPAPLPPPIALNKVPMELSMPFDPDTPPFPTVTA